MTVPLSPETIVVARLAIRTSIQRGLKVRHSLAPTWRANIRADIAALRELEKVRGDFTIKPTTRPMIGNEWTDQDDPKIGWNG